ncbi:MAG TPA: sugar ABC transporter permease [Patescibacteria group bacterium]|nr:sugar ABC transporter permease [Patescibacteria group bacterium]
MGYVLLAPFAAWVFFVLFYPAINTVHLSFTDTRTIGAEYGYVGVANYERVLQSSAFWDATLRSIVWLGGNLLLQTAIAFPTALLLRQSWRLAEQARVWVLLPWVIPTVAVTVIWQWMLNAHYGVVGYILQALQIVAGPLNVFGSRDGALPGTIVANSWAWFPLSAVVLFGAMRTIPSELYEAARVDGAGSWAQFRFITLPMIRKVMFAVGLVGALWSFNVLDVIYLITRGGPAGATLTLPVAIYDMAFRDFRIGQAAAMSVVAIVILAGAAALYVRFMSPPED